MYSKLTRQTINKQILYNINVVLDYFNQM